METIQNTLASDVGDSEHSEQVGLEDILETLLRLSQLQDDIETKQDSLPNEQTKVCIIYWVSLCLRSRPTSHAQK